MRPPHRGCWHLHVFAVVKAVCERRARRTTGRHGRLGCPQSPASRLSCARWLPACWPLVPRGHVGIPWASFSQGRGDGWGCCSLAQGTGSSWQLPSWVPPERSLSPPWPTARCSGPCTGKELVSVTLCPRVVGTRALLRPRVPGLSDSHALATPLQCE